MLRSVAAVALGELWGYALGVEPMALPPHILVVEDDLRLSALLCEYLREHSFHVRHAEDAEETYRAVSEQTPDVIVLDWMLPGSEDGISICRNLRRSFDGSILMHTARRTDGDQIRCLEVGADDYVVKPVEPRVLLARVRALLRRGHPIERTMAFGRLTVDSVAATVKVDGVAVQLTAVERQILVLLAQYAPRGVSHERLARAALDGESEVRGERLHLHVRRIDRKLQMSGSGVRVHTIRGVGCRLVVGDELS